MPGDDRQGGGPDRGGRRPGGTYTLLIDLEEPAAVEFGAVGVRDLRSGRYAYTGSALGPGGFARVERHFEVAAGDREVRHWHVDYLLGHPSARLVDDVRSPGADAECSVARRIVRGGGRSRSPASARATVTAGATSRTRASRRPSIGRSDAATSASDDVGPP